MSHYPGHQARDYLVTRYRTQIEAMGFKPEQVSDDFDFLKEGIIDSLGIMELVTDLEAHFGKPIDFEELDAENMTILGPLAAHIERKLAESEVVSADGTHLTKLPTVILRLKNRPVEVWLAMDERSIRKGLIGVEASDLTPRPDGTERGMLFVFESERPLSFWMFKTLVPLDIIYLSADCRVINSHSAQSLETRLLYPSVRPAQFVLEVPSGLVGRWGVQPGDVVAFPEGLPVKRAHP